MPSTNSVGVEIPTGLVQFPITKILMICCVGVALTASLFNMKYLFLLQYDPFIVEYGQYWRYFTFQLGSLNESDVAIMTLIWYQFRSLERLFGSRKYLNIVILSWAYTTVVIFLISNLLNKLAFAWNLVGSIHKWPTTSNIVFDSFLQTVYTKVIRIQYNNQPTFSSSF